MLKQRVIPIQLLESGKLVKTRQFGGPISVGDPVSSSKIYTSQDADELLLINIGHDPKSFEDLIDNLKKVSLECFVPLTVGGGINTIGRALEVFENGADKIAVNSAGLSEPLFIRNLASEFGSQAIISSIDVKLIGKNYCVWDSKKKMMSKIELLEYLDIIQEMGAGEVFVQNVDRDGMVCGYDLDLAATILKNCSIPVLFGSGCKNFEDLRNLLNIGISAAVCGSIFNFGDNNPLRAKAFLKNHGLNVKSI